MNYIKIKPTTLKDGCVAQLKEKIISGELQVGEYLPPERELAEAMGVSRSIVNQSVLELESEGLLEIQPRRGTMVRDYRKYPTPQSIAAIMQYGGLGLDYSIFRDLMETRLLIEEESARLACDFAYETTLSEMDELLNQLEKGRGDVTDLLFSFHYKLTQASGNSVYAMIFRGFEPLLRNLIHRHYDYKDANLEEAIRLRRELLKAIRNYDIDKAKQSIRTILMEGINALERDYAPKG